MYRQRFNKTQENALPCDALTALSLPSLHSSICASKTLLSLINAQNLCLIVATREIRKLKYIFVTRDISYFELINEASSSTALMLWELLL